MIPAVANAPAATAIQTRSKTIQSPHAQVFERWVDPPRPSANRATNDTAPNAISAASSTFAGVQSFLAIGANSWGCASAASVFATSSLRFPSAYVAPSSAPTPTTAGGTAERAATLRAG